MVDEEQYVSEEEKYRSSEEILLEGMEEVEAETMREAESREKPSMFNSRTSSKDVVLDKLFTSSQYEDPSVLGEDEDALISDILTEEGIFDEHQSAMPEVQDMI